LDLDWKKILLLNLNVTPSSLFISAKKANAEGEDGEEAGEEAGEVLELDWHCK
jgi:hypothetical protein